MRFASRVPRTRRTGGIKKHRSYEEPAAERCTSDLSVCTEGAGKAACSKWHGELMYMAALRPPYISAESRKGQFRWLKRTGAENELACFQLADGIWKSVDTVRRGDEAFVRQTVHSGWELAGGKVKPGGGGSLLDVAPIPRARQQQARRTTKHKTQQARGECPSGKVLVG
jgi:hypothetical protein